MFSSRRDSSIGYRRRISGFLGLLKSDDATDSTLDEGKLREENDGPG